MSACILLQDIIDYEFLRFGVPVLNVCRLELDEHYRNHVFNLCICIHVIIFASLCVHLFLFCQDIEANLQMYWFICADVSPFS
jgi:hypothetical protein